MAVPLRGAIVGFGYIASSGHQAAYAERAARGKDLQIVAVADICEERRCAAARAFPGARIYSDHHTLLATEAGNLDFIDIATPPSEHAAIAHKALDGGLHVLCEKPLTTTEPDARSLVAHALRARRVLFPCHNYKHAPVIKAVHQVVASGRIGKIHLATLSTYRTTNAKGTPEWRPDWRREQRYAGGGIGMDHGSHTFYLAFDWLGGYPLSLTASTATTGNFDTESTMACTMRMPNGLAIAQLTWNSGFRKVIYTLHGDKGGIRVEDDDIEISEILGPNGASGLRTQTERMVVPSLWKDASHSTWFDSVLQDFERAIASNLFVGRDTKDSYACVDAIQTAYASARAGSRELFMNIGLPGLEAVA